MPTENESPTGRVTRRGLVTGIGAAGMLGLAGCSADQSDAAPPGDARSSRIIWSVTGTDGFRAIEIDELATSPKNTPSVTEKGRLRVTSGRNGDDGNHRQAWLVPDTDGFVDGEVRAIFWPPSVMDIDVALPQMGLAARLTDTGAFIADQNISVGAYGVTIVAPWSWPKGRGRSHRGDSNGLIAMTTERAPQVGAITRLSELSGSNVYLVDRTYELEPGDEVVVNGCVDPTFNGSFTVAAAYPTANATFPWPAIVCEPGAHRDPVDVTMSIGRITRPGSADRIDPRSLYPFHVALRVLGSRATGKRWRVGDVEPTWDDTTWTVTIDTKGDRYLPPDSGGVGIVTNHMRGGAWVEFGDLEVIRYQ